MVDYMFQIFMREGTTEYGIMVMFDSSLHAIYPLHEDLSNCSMPVSFIYGSRDWTKLLDNNTAEDIVARNPNDGCRIHFLANSDHNMQMDNPQGLS